MKPGERIRELREKRGQKQKPFAELLGYSQSFLSDIELGKVEPSREFLKAVYEKTGVSSDYILYGGTGAHWHELEKKLKDVGLDEDVIAEAQGHYLGGLRSSGHEEFDRGYKSGKEEVFPVKDYDRLPTVTKKLINDMIEIMESGNDTMSGALKKNIKAFLQAIRDAKKRDDDPDPAEGKNMS